MFIRYVVLSFAGICAGVTVAAGVFAFITMLNVIPRLAHRTGTAAHLYCYENTTIAGGTLGNIVLLFGGYLPVTYVGLAIFGILAGVFVGCLSMALAENLRVIPIFVKRLKMRQGLPLILIAMAIGKFAGTIFQYFFK